MLKEKWLSILQHIVDQHEWVTSTLFTRCGHDQLTDNEKNSREWLKPDSEAHNVIVKVVRKNKLLNDMDKMTLFKYTDKSIK